MAGKMCSNLCGALGFKKLKLSPDGEKLDQRLKIPTEANDNKAGLKIPTEAIKVDKNKSERKSRKNAKKNRQEKNQRLGKNETQDY